MNSRIYQWWNNRPFEVVLYSALFFRLLAAFFARGFGMSDDHFLVIEPAQAWLDGEDTGWLPKGDHAAITPSGHSFFYPGIHFLLFKLLQFVGIFDPQIKMLTVRILHALYSLITVIYGYKIAEKIAGEKAALQTGLLLSLMWFFPFLSVRNLVETACIPVLVLATWMVIRNEKNNWRDFVLAGLLLGVGFNIRFQTFFFTIGFGLALLLSKKVKGAFLTGFAFLLVAAAFQGICDYAIWHKPFVEFGEYVRYNLENATTYYDKPWYNYFPLLLGIFIPPVSLFLLFGYVKGARKHLLLFLPAFVFFAFHSYFPNKQERFILPMIPFIIILGMCEWMRIKEASSYWKNHEKLYTGVWRFFWTLNSILLIVTSLSYSKKNRVEAMTFLSDRKDIHGLVVDDTNRGDYQLSPRFYLKNKWPYEVPVTNQTDTAKLFESLESFSDTARPNYILFYQTENLDIRKKKYEDHFILSYQTTIEPSFIDALMHKLNKRNVNSTTVIYRIDQKKNPA